MTELDPARRGDTFKRTFNLSSGWTGATFTGSVKFTLRKKEAASSVIADGDSDVVHQATVANGQITFANVVINNVTVSQGTITIPASVTNGWPVGKLLWDIQGVIANNPPDVYTIDAGTIQILGDVTRSQ